LHPLKRTVTEKNATKNILDGRMDRSKTVYSPPPLGSGGIIIKMGIYKILWKVLYKE
jgi:hypothetical protein